MKQDTLALVEPDGECGEGDSITDNTSADAD